MKTDERPSLRQTNKLMRRYAAIVGGLVWLSLAIQFYLTTTLAMSNGVGLWTGITRYFGYFTILTNILVALVLTVPLIEPQSRWAQFFSKPGVRTATAVYIAIVGITYSLLLREIWDPQGWQLVVDRMLHDISPIAYVIFWFLFVPKTTLRWSNLPAWLIYPLIYLVVALIRGAIFNWYPYPFLEVGKLGFERVFLNSVMIFIGFCVVSLLFIGIGRLMSRSTHQSSSIR